MIPVRVSVAAEQDLTASFIWYEQQVAGLGESFLREVDRAVQQIRESPRLFAQLSGRCRRALLHRFPFGLYYELRDTEIVVWAVLHLHRDPAVWMSRLDEDEL